MEFGERMLEPLFPPKPDEPLDSECCGTGCTPCVFDIYKKKLSQWEKECEEIRVGNAAVNGGEDSSIRDDVISPYEYSKFVINEILDDCQSCKILRFQKNDDDAGTITQNLINFPVRIGQHLLLRIESKSRQYTVLNVRKDGSFTIIFKIYETGLLTPLVDKLNIGDIVEMRGPFGKEFSYKANTYKNIIIFAAGTGIAPFCRIIDQILENDQDEIRILLCFACRNENQILMLGTLKEWSRSWNFCVRYYLSEILDVKKAQLMHYGMDVFSKKLDESVVKDILSIYCGNAPTYDTVNNLYLICGTKSFEKDVIKYLKCFDISEDKIKTF